MAPFSRRTHSFSFWNGTHCNSNRHHIRVTRTTTTTTILTMSILESQERSHHFRADLIDEDMGFFDKLEQDPAAFSPVDVDAAFGIFVENSMESVDDIYFDSDDKKSNNNVKGRKPQSRRHSGALERLLVGSESPEGKKKVQIGQTIAEESQKAFQSTPPPPPPPPPPPASAATPPITRMEIKKVTPSPRSGRGREILSAGKIRLTYPSTPSSAGPSSDFQHASGVYTDGVACSQKKERTKRDSSRSRRSRNDLYGANKSSSSRRRTSSANAEKRASHTSSSPSDSNEGGSDFPELPFCGSPEPANNKTGSREPSSSGKRSRTRRSNSHLTAEEKELDSSPELAAYFKKSSANMGSTSKSPRRQRPSVSERRSSSKSGFQKMESLRSMCSRSSAGTGFDRSSTTMPDTPPSPSSNTESFESTDFLSASNRSVYRRKRAETAAPDPSTCEFTITKSPSWKNRSRSRSKENPRKIAWRERGRSQTSFNQGGKDWLSQSEHYNGAARRRVSVGNKERSTSNLSSQSEHGKFGRRGSVGAHVPQPQHQPQQDFLSQSERHEYIRPDSIHRRATIGSVQQREGRSLSQSDHHKSSRRGSAPGGATSLSRSDHGRRRHANSNHNDGGGSSNLSRSDHGKNRRTSNGGDKGRRGGRREASLSNASSGAAPSRGRGRSPRQGLGATASSSSSGTNTTAGTATSSDSSHIHQFFEQWDDFADAEFPTPAPVDISPQL